MITIDKTQEYWMILTSPTDKIHYQYKPIGAQTTFSESWSNELYSNEQDWKDRLEQLEIVDEELGIGLTQSN